MSTAPDIRPPWPDELARLSQAFPDIRINGPTDLLVLVSPAPEERLVGMVAIQHNATLPSAGIVTPCTLNWAIRPRFAAEAPRLLAAAIAHARGAALPSLRCELVDLADSPSAKLLTASGFTHERTEELWRIPLAAYVARLGPLAEALSRRGQAAGFSVGPILPEQQEQLAALVSAAGLLPAQRVCFSDTQPQGFDRELSSVVTKAGRVVAVMLIRKDPPRAITETRVTAPEFIGKANLPNTLMLLRSMVQAQAHQLEEVILTANPASAAETIRMANRLGGTCLRTHQFWAIQTG